MTSLGNVFTYLDSIRERPHVYCRSLMELESKIGGYYGALWTHRIVEQAPNMCHHFLIWMHYRTGLSTSGGWALILTHEIVGFDKQLERFFELVDEYRQLVPVVLYRVTLEEHHNPTRKRSKIGIDKFIEKPMVIEIVNYNPDPLHFLRFHYVEHIKDGWLLEGPKSSSCDTTVDDAMEWVSDEFQVCPEEWQSVVG